MSASSFQFYEHNDARGFASVGSVAATGVGNPLPINWSLLDRPSWGTAMKSVEREYFDHSMAVGMVVHGARTGEKVIVCIARFDPQKGLPILFRAFSKLLNTGHSGLRLVLLGVGPTELELRQLAQALDIADHVSFLGQRDDVPQILTVADLLVLASSHEGFGHCIVEGLASRIPVVSTDTSGPRLILSGAEKAWLTAHDDDALSAAIDEALDGLSEEVLDANEAYVARFDEVRIASRMLEIYKKIHNADLTCRD